MDLDALPTLTSPDELAAFGVPQPRVRDKVLPSLLPVHEQFLAVAPLVLIGTSDAEGRLDVSPKGDPDRVAHVLDQHTLVIPERPGNRRMDGFHNLLLDPHIGLLFVVPGRGDTLRVNGTARLVTDGPFFDDLVVGGHRPAVATVVEIEEVFYHCPKAFMRSRAWSPETWRPDAVPSYADIAKLLWRAGDDPAEVDAHYAPAAYESELYRA
ncbi:phosphohydrolase [Marmoricola endophyticus]|uniref:Phosphohydrolase n=1 Tax=Marmoricola endophyticus TaxID=2040280 RepID=A0A917F4V7_9ACTN|nr:MSMEG_1061 family FMN-dependent PPOX-type flavoprotein [Marmoricola endophyticus]GGF52717.1 phosphohydrolase [Marmoricola endophyticus]